jgi:aerobic-type carbon monoxide dehydrogenase small subunit (CoxS/CutS family)
VSLVSELSEAVVARAEREIALRVNGREMRGRAEPRMTLADFLRTELGLTGTRLGCEQGICGSCTILMGERSVRSCLLFAVQAAGHEITTVEGLAESDGELHPIQKAFSREYGLQCGFCTPGLLMTVLELMSDEPDLDESIVRTRLNGNLCRCTGYENIVRAVLQASLQARA